MSATLRAEASDEFKAKEEAVYADMGRLIKDIEPMQTHVVQFYDLLREVRPHPHRSAATARSCRFSSAWSHSTQHTCMHVWSGSFAWSCA